MKSNNLIFILLSGLFFHAAASKITVEPIQLLFNSRFHLLDVLECQSTCGSIDTTNSPSISYKKNMIYALKDSSFSWWDKNKTSLILEFINYYINTARKYKKCQYFIGDSTSISILISLLDYPDLRPKPTLRDTSKESKQEYHDQLFKPEPNWCRDALKILTYQVFFKSLADQSENIVDHLSRCKEPELAKLKLLLLCKNNGLDKNKKDSILKKNDKFEEAIRLDYSKAFYKTVDGRNVPIERMPLWVKTLLGDTLTEKQILLGLKRKDENDFNVRSYANDALFIWSDSCKYAFLNLFNRDMPICPPDANYKLCRSLQDTLLVLLARRHPDDPIFSNILSYNRIGADYCKPETQVPYFKKFAEWVQKRYNFKITYKGFLPYFLKDISKEKVFIKEHCKQ